MNDDEIRLLDALRGGTTRSAYLIGMLYSQARMRPKKPTEFEQLEAQMSLPDPVTVPPSTMDDDTLLLLGEIRKAHHHTPGMIVERRRKDRKKRYQCARDGCYWVSDWRD